jgi:hypothetical protein
MKEQFTSSGSVFRISSHSCMTHDRVSYDDVIEIRRRQSRMRNEVRIQKGEKEGGREGRTEN